MAGGERHLRHIYGRDEDGLDRSLGNRPVGLDGGGLGIAGRAGAGTGGRRTLFAAAADTASPPSRTLAPLAVPLGGPRTPGGYSRHRNPSPLRPRRQRRGARPPPRLSPPPA